MMTLYRPPRHLEPLPDRDSDAEAVGEVGERLLCKYHRLDRDDNCHYDATTPTGLPVQLKATAWRIRNGTSPTGAQKYAHGRFRLYESDHAWLLENDGMYGFLVYERHPRGIIPLFSRLLPAEFLDGFILPDNPWYDGPIPRKRNGGDLRLAWPDVFPNTGAEL